METLTAVDFWEQKWETLTIPQIILPRENSEFHQICKKYLPQNKSFIEIGCAPGKYLVYFAREFGYRVSGLEYAPKAAQFTVKNLESLHIPADIIVEDFFTHKPTTTYEVVFTRGFIEHFDETENVVKKLVRLADPNQGIIITIVPCMGGLNRMIGNIFWPKLSKKHHMTCLNKIVEYHEKQNVETLYADYMGSFRIFEPVQAYQINKYNKVMADLTNLPVRVWNKLVVKTTQTLDWYPHDKFINSGIMYIGRRKGE